MKCTNKIGCFLLAGCFLFFAGCRGESEQLASSYQVYRTTASIGISAFSESEDKKYFSSDLCVSDDISLGTDVTNSQVAQGAGTFHLSSNTVVYAKDIYKKLYPASTTKIMTAYLALKYCSDLNVPVTVSANAVDQAPDSSVCGLRAGDVLTMRDLLYGLMLQSGNDAAIAIAEYISGDVASFADLMNEEARLLGATQTHFVNPNGLPDPEHYTSVYDLYLMFRAALPNQTFLEIINTKSYTAVYTGADGKAAEAVWANTNPYLNGRARIPEGFTIYGGKTGTTGEAGYCLVLYSHNQEDEPIISIVLKADGRYNLYLLMNEMLEGFAN
ncbi:MAG: D-alanyl-D-alanine carboxypeptidase [Clostridiales bacterium]|nr:D-alanyl-D-alanine carboxypeptidase [Clostridiales bacterium]